MPAGPNPLSLWICPASRVGPSFARKHRIYHRAESLRMRSRTLAVAGVTTAALAAATALAGTASAHTNAGSMVAHHVVSAAAAPAKGGKACYDNNSTGDTGIAVTSAN